VTEYVGDAAHLGLGVREAYLVAGERAAATADHSVIEGRAPAGATLRLRKTFSTPTSQGTSVPESLETTLEIGADGAFEWHVNPSNRPDVREGKKRSPKPETWTMTCELGGAVAGQVSVAVSRGRRVTVGFGPDCSPTARCAGAKATIVGSGEIRGRSARDVILASPQGDSVDAGGGRDLVCGAGGRDTIDGGGGGDRCRGGPGRDRIRSC
jgi:hypothetical protein